MNDETEELEFIVGENAGIGSMMCLGDNEKLIKGQRKMVTFIAPIELFKDDRVSIRAGSGRVVSIVRAGEEIYHVSGNRP